MTAKICPHCKEEQDPRGFWIHTEACKLKQLRKKYASSIANMSAEQEARFLRKAGGG